MLDDIHSMQLNAYPELLNHYTLFIIGFYFFQLHLLDKGSMFEVFGLALADDGCV